jgi:DNA-directed RNA polymerase specialized sigma subunit
LQIAWVLTCLLLTTILINFIFALVLIVAAIFRYLKSKIKCKRKKEVQKGEQSQSKNEELPMKNNIDPPQVDVTKFADFSKLGYESYEYYPGAYAFPKIKEEVKNDLPFEKNNSEFNFYEHI